MELTSEQTWINTIWEALDEAQLYVPFSDEEWHEICAAMTWITEELNKEIERNGEINNG